MRVFDDLPAIANDHGPRGAAPGDDALLAELRDAVLIFDPVAPDAHRAARASLDWHRFASQFAALVTAAGD